MKTRASYDAGMKRLAVEAYAKHRIVEGGLYRWMLRGDGSFYWTEIVALFGGRLFVHGDVESVLFKGSSSDGALGALGLIFWVAGCSLDYLSSKVEGGRAQVEVFDLEVFESDVEAYLADPCFEDNYKNKEQAQKETAVLREALAFPGDDERYLKAHLYEEGVDPELFGSWGRVLAPRIYYAQSAVARFQSLLGPELEENNEQGTDIRRSNSPSNGGDSRDLPEG